MLWSDIVSNAPSSVRFLISNAAAGSVIGKGGATISDFQAQSGARIQLSRNHEYFPGTTDRIILLSGTVSEVLTALHLILTKILNEVRGISQSRFSIVASALVRDGVGRLCPQLGSLFNCRLKMRLKANKRLIKSDLWCQTMFVEPLSARVAPPSSMTSVLFAASCESASSLLFLDEPGLVDCQVDGGRLPSKH